MDAEQPIYTTPPRLARRYGVSVDKVVRWILAGELEALNLATSPSGRPRYKITEEAIQAFERRRTVLCPPHHGPVDASRRCRLDSRGISGIRRKTPCTRPSTKPPLSPKQSRRCCATWSAFCRRRSTSRQHQPSARRAAASWSARPATSSFA